jgi:hypothetical protein
MRKNDELQGRILESLILSGCEQFKMYYGGDDNLPKLIAEGKGWIAKRKYELALVAREERRKQREEEQQDQQAPPQQPKEPERKVEVTPELTRELSFDETADIFSVSIKKDKAPKLITFSGMLLAQTNKDQLNVGFQAESSAGKSYIPFEVANYFPPNEIIKIASASPTAFYHKGGAWDDVRKAQVCDLEHKIIVFSDQPGFQLMEKIRSVLSKDDKELTYWITEKNRSGANRTKTIIIKGFASFLFCTTKLNPDEQEKTRMILLSPETDRDKLYESLELSALRNADSDEYRKVIEQDPKRKWLIDRILAIRQLGIREIIIPDRGKPVFGRFIREHEHLQARHQRDLPRIFGFIKAHALLNCFNRERLTNGKSGTIVANQADIEAGFDLYKEIEESNELGLSPYIYKIYKEVIEPNLNANGLSRKEIRSHYFSVFHKFLPPKFEDSVMEQIEAAGLIQQEPDRDDRRKLLVKPPATNLIELPKYIPQDCGYSSTTAKITDDDQNHNLTQEKEEKRVLTVSGDISRVSSIRELTKKIMRDKGFFTKAEWMTVLMCLPKQDPLYCDEDQAEQMLQALIGDGMIEEEEFEPGKYRPTEKLSEKGGD